MRIAIVGPGAMGILFCYLFSRAENTEIHLLDHNPERVEKIKKEGLFIEGVSGEHHIYPQITMSPADIWQVDLTTYDGNLMVIGTPGSGKALFVQTLITGLAATHSPQDLNLYFLDFGPRTLQIFGRLPHSGGVFLPTVRERVGRLLAFLESEIAYRTNLFAQAQVGNPEEFRERYPDHPMPAVVVFLDSYAKFKDVYPDDTDVLMNIVRSGKAADIHLIITADMPSEITMRLRDMIMNRVAFQMVNQDDYRDLFGQRPIPIAEIVGRGVIRIDDNHLFIGVFVR